MKNRPQIKFFMKSAGIIGAFTFVSRILGFVRDILFAKFFGTTLVAEAFVVSFKLPNLFRDLVGEGAMNSAIVPVLTETHARKGEAEFWKLARNLLVWMMLAMILVTTLGILFAPQVVRLVAPGFDQDPDKFHLTIQLTRLMFPFLILIGLSAYFMGILNSLGNFGTSALGPALLNLTMIVSFAFWVPVWGVKGLVYGVLAGGLAQCSIQLISFLRLRFHWARGSLVSAEVKKILKLLVPRLWGTAVYQISVFVDTIIASFYWIVGEGGQSALYYSSRLFQLPLAIFGVSLAQAVLPAFSGHHAREEKEAFTQALRSALRGLVFTCIPASIGLAALSGPIVTVLFKRGAFDDYSVRVTSDALFYYSLGLLSCGFIKIFVSAFYALQDTRTPVKTATAGLITNVILNLAFMHTLKIGGLALATTLAATLNAFLLGRSLTRRLEFKFGSDFWKLAVQCTFAGLVMGFLDFFVFRDWILSDLPLSHTGMLFKLGVTLGISALVYYVICLLFRMEEASKLGRYFVSKVKRESQTP